MSTDAVNQQIQELEKLRRQNRRTNQAILGTVSAIVIVGVGAIIGSAHSLTAAGPKQDEFIRQLGGRMQTEVLPAVQRVVEPSLKRLKPAVEAEIQRLDDRAPQVAEAALRELNILGTNLVTRSEAILNETVGKELQEREARLQRIYPGVTDQQIATLAENIHAELQDQLVKVDEKIFAPHLDSIQNILADVDKIEQTEHVTLKGDISPWQVAFLFMDVFTQEFRDVALTDNINLQEPAK